MSPLSSSTSSSYDWPSPPPFPIAPPPFPMAPPPSSPYLPPPHHNKPPTWAPPPSKITSPPPPCTPPPPHSKPPSPPPHHFSPPPLPSPSPPYHYPVEPPSSPIPPSPSSHSSIIIFTCTVSAFALFFLLGCLLCCCLLRKKRSHKHHCHSAVPSGNVAADIDSAASHPIDIPGQFAQCSAQSLHSHETMQDGISGQALKPQSTPFGSDDGSMSVGGIPTNSSHSEHPTS